MYLNITVITYLKFQSDISIHEWHNNKNIQFRHVQLGTVFLYMVNGSLIYNNISSLPCSTIYWDKTNLTSWLLH